MTQNPQQLVTGTEIEIGAALLDIFPGDFSRFNAIRSVNLQKSAAHDQVKALRFAIEYAFAFPKTMAELNRTREDCRADDRYAIWREMTTSLSSLLGDALAIIEGHADPDCRDSIRSSLNLCRDVFNSLSGYGVGPSLPEAALAWPACYLNGHASDWLDNRRVGGSEVEIELTARDLRRADAAMKAILYRLNSPSASDEKQPRKEMVPLNQGSSAQDSQPLTAKRPTGTNPGGESTDHTTLAIGLLMIAQKHGERITQQQLADKAGCSRQTLWRSEKFRLAWRAFKGSGTIRRGRKDEAGNIETGSENTDL